MKKFLKTKLILFSIICSLAIPAIGYASPIEDKTIEQNEILQTISIKQQELDNLSNRYAEAMIEKDNLIQQLENTQKDLIELNNNLNYYKDKLDKQCITLYKQDGINLLDIILSTENFDSFISNLDYYNKYINQSEILIEQIKEKEKTTQEKKQELENQQQELDNQLVEIEQLRIAAENNISLLEQEYSQLDAEIAAIVLQQQLINSNISEEVINSFISGNYTEETYQTIAAAANNIDWTSLNIDSDIVLRAYSMLGTAYSWGGTTSEGFDCSGFVSYCLTGQEGVRLGSSSTFMRWNQTDNPQPGDVCVSDGHTGIYVGDGKMVHASTYGVGVIESPVQNGMIYVTAP